MSAMEVADIQHLAGLARIALTEKEAGELAAEFDAILDYVAQVTEVSANAAVLPMVGVHANVLREDTETHVPGAYTAALLAAAPQQEGAYVRVQKILDKGLKKNNDA